MNLLFFTDYVRMQRGVLQITLTVLLLLASAPGLWAADVELPEGPRQLVDTMVDSAGRVIQLDANGNFQAALDSAEPGDIIELAAGAVFRGNFILPRKSGTQWISIRSGQRKGKLPLAGTRVSPVDKTKMATLTSASGPILVTAPGAHHYRFTGIEFRPATADELTSLIRPIAQPVFLDTLIKLDAPKTSGDHHPHHFIIERCYLHGDPLVGGRRGIIMNSAYTAVVDSYLSDFKMEGADSQAIIGWDGTGPFSITNNYLEAAGENVMFGGADPTVTDRVPADIEIKGNHFAKPLSWMPGNTEYQKTNWSIKNLFELKNARRVLVEGNLFEYNWIAAQNGYAILFTVRNQNGKAPWSVVEDISFSSNVIQHVANGINILGHDDINASQQTRRILVSNNLFDDVGWNHEGGTLMQLLEGVAHLTIEHNTALNTDKIIASDGVPHQWTAIQNNIVMHNQYGIIGTGTGVGLPTLEHYFHSVKMQGNVVVGGSKNLYPAGNSFPVNLAAVGFTDTATGDYRLHQESSYISNDDKPDIGVDFSRLCLALSETEKPVFCADIQE